MLLKLYGKCKHILSSIIDIALLPPDLSIGKGCRIKRSRFDHAERISIGSFTYVGPGCHLSVASRPQHVHQEVSNIAIAHNHLNSSAPIESLGRIRIGDHCYITSSLEIFSRNSVVIEDNVMIASNCLIVDHHHGMNPARGPYRFQPAQSNQEVVIRESCWIGKNTCILPGVTIGKGSIVGSNSVVTKDVPSFTIVAGCPAYIIKTWDWADERWVRV